jgi:hypothetical protein
MQAKSHFGGLGRRFLLDRKLSRDGIRHIIHIAYGTLLVKKKVFANDYLMKKM